jgi:hypothetical protein
MREIFRSWHLNTPITQLEEDVLGPTEHMTLNGEHGGRVYNEEEG